MAAVGIQLIDLPSELQLNVFLLLSSVTDAFNLRATCRTLHDIWTTHRPKIINDLVIEQLECYPYARQLLITQHHHGPSSEPKALSDHDLFRLTQNARRIEEVIQHIEQKFALELKISGVPTGKRRKTCEGSNSPPSNLTHTERLRVIRACYQIWSMSTYSDKKSVKSSVYAFRPRELFYLTELLDLAVDIKFPSTRLWEISPAFRASKSALRKFYHDTYGCDRHRTRHSYNDPVALFFIWDYWQDTLKNLICRRPLSNMRWDPQAESLEHLWDYEAGDELLIAKD